MEIEIPGKKKNTIKLESFKKDKRLKESDEWVIKGYGWPSNEEAKKQGKRCQNAISYTFVKLRIGANFGNRVSQGFLAKGFLKQIEESAGRPVINDKLGLLTYQLDPRPLLGKMGGVNLTRNVNVEKFINELQDALRNPPSFTEREQLAVDIFSASFFQKSADARLLLLIISIESLLDLNERPKEAQAHVDHLIELTDNSTVLTDKDKASLKGSLKWLKKQSIRQATRELADKYLNHKKYKNKSAFEFIDECYSVRSNLVHGNLPYPSFEKVGSLVGQLEVLVSDLLTAKITAKSNIDKE